MSGTNEQQVGRRIVDLVGEKIRTHAANACARAIRQLPTWLVMACLGCGKSTTGAQSSTHGSDCGEVSASAGGAGETSIGSCDSCDACPAGMEFVECGAAGDFACVCESLESANRDDYESLMCCQFDSPCLPASYERSGPLPGSWTNQHCLFTALADRTVGRYEFHSRFCDTGCHDSDVLLLVTSEGDVLQSEIETSQVASNQSGILSTTTVARSYGPDMRCTLAASFFFDNCLTGDAEPEGLAEPCGSIDEWFVNCRPTSPECPK